MGFQEDMLIDIIKIKNLAEQAERTMKRKESETKYNLILKELEEITGCIGRIRQHSNVEIHLIQGRVENDCNMDM